MKKFVAYSILISCALISTPAFAELLDLGLDDNFNILLGDLDDLPPGTYVQEPTGTKTTQQTTQTGTVTKTTEEEEEVSVEFERGTGAYETHEGEKEKYEYFQVRPIKKNGLR